MRNQVFPKVPMLIASRELSIPEHLSPAAQAGLQMRLPRFSYPDLTDRAGWKDLIKATDQGLLAMMPHSESQAEPLIQTIEIEGVIVYIITPHGLSNGDRGIVLDMHGGALIFGGGEVCRAMAQGVAERLQRRIWSIDYRMPPDWPFPAALDDCFTVYKALLRIRQANEIVIHGTSAGGNLATSLILRARDDGLPLPAGVILASPEIDLTESGDSFQTNLGVDPLLSPLLPVNQLYASGQDLKHPYLSPLFGDLTNFPPAILTSGTRDLLLSNTVRLHRALRKAGTASDLHILEAAGHAGFPASPESEELDKECRIFIVKLLHHIKTETTA